MGITKNELALRPSYWASVSGGKDSLFMLKLILENPNRYPLNGVIHFELEIDYPFIKIVIDYMESECKKAGIKFVRIKPRKTWLELYEKYGFPTRKNRWCNSAYKLDAKKQLDKYMLSLGYYVVSYIGLCADETKRIEKREKYAAVERYPLAEFGINESVILEWAKTQPIFNNYYLTNRRCGCMYCPITSMLNYAYLRKYYPDYYRFMIDKMHESELNYFNKTGKRNSVISGYAKYNSWYLARQIESKYLPKLNQMEKRG